MNFKSFLVAGLLGGFIYWLLGWLFYGIIFVDTFPMPGEESNSLLFVTLGCFTVGFFVSYIYNKWAAIKTVGFGIKAGAIIGLFISLIINFFKIAETASVNYEQFATDLGITVVSIAITGGIVGLVNGKVK